MVQALVGLASADQHLGRAAEALTLAHEAVGVARRAGYRLLEGQALTILGEVERDR